MQRIAHHPALLESLSASEAATSADLLHSSLPPSAWALANVTAVAAGGAGANPATGGKVVAETGDNFLPGLNLPEYIQAVCSLAKAARLAEDALRSGSGQKKSRAQGSDVEEDEDEDEEGGTGGGGRRGGKRRRIHPCFFEDLSLLCQRWHVLRILQETKATGTSTSAITTTTTASCLQSVAAGSAGIASGSHNSSREMKDCRPSIGVDDFARLYALLLGLFSEIGASRGGGIPLLNVLAFTPSVLPTLWDWLADHLRVGKGEGAGAAAGSGEQAQKGGNNSVDRQQQRSALPSGAAAPGPSAAVSAAATSATDTSTRQRQLAGASRSPAVGPEYISADMDVDEDVIVVGERRAGRGGAGRAGVRGPGLAVPSMPGGAFGSWLARGLMEGGGRGREGRVFHCTFCRYRCNERKTGRRWGQRGSDD